MFGYGENPDTSLKIQNILQYFVNVLQFLVWLFQLYYFEIQSYV